MAFEPPIEPRLALLPLDEREWDWKRFERFCLDLVNGLPDVSHADFHGTQETSRMALTSWRSSLTADSGHTSVRSTPRSVRSVPKMP